MIVLLCGTLTSCSTRVNQGYLEVEWDFIESTGGMLLGEPYFDGASNVLHIPVIQDFTGKSVITTTPTRTNTGLLCHHFFLAFATSPIPGTNNLSIIAYAVTDSGQVEAGCDEIQMDFNVMQPMDPTRRINVYYGTSRFLGNEFISAVTF